MLNISQENVKSIISPLLSEGIKHDIFIHFHFRAVLVAEEKDNGWGELSRI